MCLMSPEQLQNKFPWINTDGVALASYGEACSQRASGCGHLGWEASTPCSHVTEQCLPLASGPPTPGQASSVLPQDLTRCGRSA